MSLARLFFALGWIIAIGASVAFFMLWSMFFDLRAKERLTSVESVPTRSATIISENWAPTARRVLLIGDSRIRRWPSLPVSQNVVFAKSGVGGETSGRLERRFEQDALSLSLPPNELIIATGINDLVAASLHAFYGPEFLSGIVTQLVGRLESFVDQAEIQGMTVKIATIIQPAKPDLLRQFMFWDDSLLDLVSEANKQIEDMAARRGIAVIDFNALLDAGDGFLPDVFSVDTLHFSSAAYDTLNAVLIEEYNSK